MDSKLLKIKFQSRAELVVDKIINSIINGELSDGELLPPRIVRW
jgi:DNA-binding FadR family transcriptional regulator